MAAVAAPLPPPAPAPGSSGLPRWRPAWEWAQSGCRCTQAATTPQSVRLPRPRQTRHQVRMPAVAPAVTKRRRAHPSIQRLPAPHLAPAPLLPLMRRGRAGGGGGGAQAQDAGGGAGVWLGRGRLFEEPGLEGRLWTCVRAACRHTLRQTRPLPGCLLPDLLAPYTPCGPLPCSRCAHSAVPPAPSPLRGPLPCRSQRPVRGGGGVPALLLSVHTAAAGRGGGQRAGAVDHGAHPQPAGGAGGRACLCVCVRVCARVCARVCVRFFVLCEAAHLRSGSARLPFEPEPPNGQPPDTAPGTVPGTACAYRLQGQYYQAACTSIDAERQVLHCAVNKCHVGTTSRRPPPALSCRCSARPDPDRVLLLAGSWPGRRLRRQRCPPGSASSIANP